MNFHATTTLIFADVVDKNGEPLGVTIGLSLAMPRNAESVEPDNENNAPAVVPTTLPNTTSDVRLVLEANVRATQMAFVHNQRTLEVGLRMAETLRDSVQVLASSQADWIKSISSARGFFRSAGQPITPVEVKQLTVTTGGDEHDDDDDEYDEDDDVAGNDGGGDDDGDGGSGRRAATPHWSEQVVPFLHQVAMQVMPAINAWSARQKADGTGRKGSGTGSDTAAGARDTEANADVQRAAPAEQGHAAQLAAAVTAAASPGPGINVLRLLQLLPQDTSTKLMAIQTALSSDEQVDAMHILKSYAPDELQDLLTVFDAASLDECVGFLRRLIADWRRMQAAKRTNAPAERGPNGAPGTPSATV
jgi:hypothetical protein